MADARAEADAAQLASLLKRTTGGVRTVSLSVQRFASATRAIVVPVGVLLALFLIHQLFLWISASPEVAMDRAALIFEIVEVRLH